MTKDEESALVHAVKKSHWNPEIGMRLFLIHHPHIKPTPEMYALAVGVGRTPFPNIVGLKEGPFPVYIDKPWLDVRAWESPEQKEWEAEMQALDKPFFRPGTDDEAFWNCVYGDDEYGVPAFAPEDVVLDIGLSIGAVTMKAWERCSRNIHAFEACPENFAVAQKNVGHLEGVNLYHSAVVGDRQPSTLPFPVGNNSFYIQEHATVDVPTITLHEIINKIGNVRWMKIDCEGSEWEILYSLPTAMFGQIAEIIGEYHQPSQTYWGLVQNPRRPKYDYITLQQYLQDNGYFTQFRVPTPPSMSGSFHAVRR